MERKTFFLSSFYQNFNRLTKLFADVGISQKTQNSDNLVAIAAQNLTTAGHVIWIFSNENVMNCSIQKVKLKH